MGLLSIPALNILIQWNPSKYGLPFMLFDFYWFYVNWTGYHSVKDKNWVVHLSAWYWFYNIPLDFVFHMSGDMHNQLLFTVSAAYGYCLAAASLPVIARRSATKAIIFVISFLGSQVPQFWNGIPESFLTHPNGTDPNFYLLHVLVHAGLLINTWCIFATFHQTTEKSLVKKKLV